jgi:hypothetical protein
MVFLMKMKLEIKRIIMLILNWLVSRRLEYLWVKLKVWIRIQDKMTLIIKTVMLLVKYSIIKLNLMRKINSFYKLRKRIKKDKMQ